MSPSLSKRAEHGKRWLMLSVWPKHSTKLLSGEKTAELRRVRPCVGQGDVIVIYATHPCKAIVGTLEVEEVFEGAPDELWDRHQERTAISREEFDQYYEGAESAFAILVSRANPLRLPIPLDRVREFLPGFRPPQGYLYVGADSPIGIALQQELCCSHPPS